MTTSDPQRPGAPDEQTVVVPRGFAAPPPTPYGRPDQGHRDQGYHDHPTTNLAYNPYGQQFPAVDQYPDGYPVPPPARRPGSLFLALLLHLVSAVPFLGGAAFVLLSGVTIQGMIPPETLAEFESVTGIAVSSLFALVFGLAIFVGAVALLFVLFSILAVARRNWARLLVAIMTVPFVLLAALGAFGVFAASAQDPDVAADPTAVSLTLAFVAGPGLLALIGTILMFLPGANRFFARR